MYLKLWANSTLIVWNNNFMLRSVQRWQRVYITEQSLRSKALTITHMFKENGQIQEKKRNQLYTRSSKFSWADCPDVQGCHLKISLVLTRLSLSNETIFMRRCLRHVFRHNALLTSFASCFSSQCTVDIACVICFPREINWRIAYTCCSGVSFCGLCI